MAKSFAAITCIAATLVAAAAGQAPLRVSPSSGKSMCSALAPADFSRQGVPVSSLSQANVDGTDGAYCVYQSKAGKVEFDIFYPAGATAAEIKATEKTVMGEGAGRHESMQVAGADDAQFAPSLADQPASAAIVVRKGKAVFDVMIPKSDKARQQLLALAQIVLSRLK